MKFETPGAMLFENDVCVGFENRLPMTQKGTLIVHSAENDPKQPEHDVFRYLWSSWAPGHTWHNTDVNFSHQSYSNSSTKIAPNATRDPIGWVVAILKLF